MRESLTYLAIGLILLLTAALVGPYFIVWTDYRTQIEAQLSKALGTPVSTAGPIKIKLLPTPQISLGLVAVGDRATGPWLRADGLHAELALTSLLRGEIRLNDASFQRPQLEITSTADGSVSLPVPAAEADGAVQLDHVAVRDGTLVVHRPGGDLRLSGLTFSGSAKSLTGPFQVEGEVAPAADDSAASPVKFTLATGAREGNRLRLKLGADLAAQGLRIDLDGAAVLGGEAHNEAAFEGQLKLAGNGLAVVVGDGQQQAPLPWRLTGAIKADLHGGQMEALELHAGADEHGLNATGDAQVELGQQPRAQIRLNARQLDLDRLGVMPAGTSPAAALQALVAYAADDNRLRPLPLPLDLAFTAGVAQLGGEALSDVVFKYAQSSDRQAQISFAGSAPGRSHLEFSGTLEPGIAIKLGGTASFSVQDTGRLESWLNGSAAAGPQWHRPALLSGIKAITAAGAVELSATGFAARDLTFSLDRSSFAGSVVYTRALEQSREKLFANLASERIELDDMPDLTALAGLSAPLDFLLALEAQSAQIARPGQAALQVGRITAKLTKTGDVLALEQLYLANVGGAAIAASATVGSKASHLEARLDAAQLMDFAALLRRLLPGSWSDVLVSRAAGLANSRITLLADGASPGTGVLPTLTGLALGGTVGATKITAAFKPEASGGLSLSAQLDAPEAAPLLRQLGLVVPPTPGFGPGRISFSGKKQGDRFEDIIADATLAGGAFSYRGTGLLGKAAFKSANVAPLLQILGLAGADANRSGPASGTAGEATADLVLGTADVTLQKLSGTLAGSKFDGQLAWHTATSGDGLADAGPAAPRLTGALTLARASLATFASFSLGAQQATKPGALWSDAAFGAGLPNLPVAQIKVSVANLDLSATLPGRDASFTLRLAPGKTSVEDLAVNAAGGKIGGRFDIRRDTGVAALSGRVTLDAVPLVQATLKGKLSGAIDFAATGDSQLALVTGLAGSGDLQLAQPQIAAFDPAALTRVINLSVNEKIALADTAVMAAMSTELDRAALVLPNLRLPVTLAAGVARLGPLTLAETPVQIDTSASLNLRNLEFELRGTLTSPVAPKFWSGPLPQVALSWKGIWPKLERQVNAAPLANGLAAAAIARDSERLAAVDADIRERAFFNRKLKAIEQERQRLAAEAEAARIALEDEKRRALEAARTQSDIQRRQNTDPGRNGAQLQPRPPGSPPAVEAQQAPGAN